MILQKLNETVKVRVRRDDDLKLKLAKANGKKVASIDRWLLNDSQMLTTVTNLSIIREHFGLKAKEELTETFEKAIA